MSHTAAVFCQPMIRPKWHRLSGSPIIIDVAQRNLTFAFTISSIVFVLLAFDGHKPAWPWGVAAALFLWLAPLKKPLVVVALAFVSIRLLFALVFASPSLSLGAGALGAAVLALLAARLPKEKNEALFVGVQHGDVPMIDVLVWVAILLAVGAWLSV